MLTIFEMEAQIQAAVEVKTKAALHETPNIESGRRHPKYEQIPPSASLSYLTSEKQTLTIIMALPLDLLTTSTAAIKTP